MTEGFTITLKGVYKELTIINTMKYQTTKAECQKKINANGNVCDRCGRDIKPLKTVNNAGEPTYWAGCLHGGEEGHFTAGTKKELFVLARKLVCNNERYYSHSQKNEYSKNKLHREYWFQMQVSRFCRLLAQAEYLKKNKPRKTKKEFLADNQNKNRYGADLVATRYKQTRQ